MMVRKVFQTLENFGWNTGYDSPNPNTHSTRTHMHACTHTHIHTCTHTHTHAHARVYFIFYRVGFTDKAYQVVLVTEVKSHLPDVLSVTQSKVLLSLAYTV